jgi:hypothetical protein
MMHILKDLMPRMLLMIESLILASEKQTGIILPSLGAASARED